MIFPVQLYFDLKKYSVPQQLSIRCVCIYLDGIDGVSNNTQHVKTRHDGLRQIHVLSKSQGGVISATCQETRDMRLLLKGLSHTSFGLITKGLFSDFTDFYPMLTF